MQTIGLATKQLQGPQADGRTAALIQFGERQGCSDFLARRPVQNVLLVGAERPDEFADAMRLVRQGRKVVVVNPRVSPGARGFTKDGGKFFRTTIECLPRALGSFDLICENYPFTIARFPGVCDDDPCPVWLNGRVFRTYMMARLRRLAPRGRWITFTESPGFARTLSSIVRHDQVLQRNFNGRIISLTRDQAPRSFYPKLSTRFKVIVQRYPAESGRTARMRARRAFL